MQFYILGIVGSRSFRDEEEMEAQILSVKERIGDRTPLAIVSGQAGGADTLARLAAIKLGIQVIDVPAMWTVFGKRAGYHRNPLIAQIADELIAFWDGESAGTADTITKAHYLGKSINVVTFEKE